MPRYHLHGNYGTFEIERFVNTPDEEYAWQECGIMSTLIDAGWTVTSSPDGEEWDVTLVTDDDLDFNEGFNNG